MEYRAVNDDGVDNIRYSILSVSSISFLHIFYHNQTIPFIFWNENCWTTSLKTFLTKNIYCLYLKTVWFRKGLLGEPLSPSRIALHCIDRNTENFLCQPILSIPFLYDKIAVLILSLFTSPFLLCWLFATLVCLFRVTQYRNSSVRSILFLIGHS